MPVFVPKNAKLSTFKIKKIISLFCLDINASKAASLLGINRNTINYWFNRFRRAIYAQQHQEFKKMLGETEIDECYFRHFRVNHGDNEFSKGRGIHINGIENFWSFTKRRLAKFNGVKKNFELHLKECEWHYGKKNATLEKELWNIIKTYY